MRAGVFCYGLCMCVYAFCDCTHLNNVFWVVLVNGERKLPINIISFTKTDVSLGWTVGVNCHDVKGVPRPLPITRGKAVVSSCGRHTLKYYARLSRVPWHIRQSQWSVSGSGKLQNDADSEPLSIPLSNIPRRTSQGAAMLILRSYFSYCAESPEGECPPLK